VSWYTVAWTAWLGAFLALELPALANRRDGDTLSETVWRWFHVRDDRQTAITWAMRAVLSLFLTWLLFHLTLGWFTPTHPLPWR